MWIDTHTHFDFSAFDNTRQIDWQQAREQGVSAQFVMGVYPQQWHNLPTLCRQFSQTYFALGIHPMYCDNVAVEKAIVELEQHIIQSLSNPRFIGVGEIGLDGFIKDSDWDKQIQCFTAQLKLAKRYDLPVFMHVRKAQDHVLKYTRQIGIQRGIAHAFNGSLQQANQYIEQGFKLGFGGAMTYPRAKNLQRLIRQLPLSAFVLETDAPDMPPTWVSSINHSYELPKIAQCFADIRGIDLIVLAEQIYRNTAQVVPVLRAAD